jgi:YD repeat-containing protein
MSPETARPLETLSATGLLWLFNSEVLHPRGFALALAYNEAGLVVGWTMQGDGVAPMAFDAETNAEKSATVEAFFANERVARAANATAPSAPICSCPPGSAHDLFCPIALLARIAALEARGDRPAAEAVAPAPVPPPAHTGASVSILRTTPRFQSDRTGFAASYSDESNAQVVGKLHGVEGA